MPQRFEDLPSTEQQAIRASGATLTELAFEYTTTALIAGRAKPGSIIQSASGLILRVTDGLAFLTAWHVVDAYLTRAENEAPLFFYVGEEPLSSIDLLFTDEDNDIALVRLPEPRRPLLARIYEAFVWPPPRPSVGNAVFFAGFPAAFRQRPDHVNLEFKDFAGLLPVTVVGEQHFVCQFSRENWISLGYDPIPSPGTDLGGLSGAPVFLRGQLAHPLVGVVSEFNQSYELLHIKMLDHLPTDLVPQAT
ncbi:MAG TPA: serine protease [Chthoniobacteraceae bacterium]|nr:serine protease [Chthoniobacteraceae bacterium]